VVVDLKPKFISDIQTPRAGRGRLSDRLRVYVSDLSDELSQSKCYW
jgi:hypothetical protein